MARATECLITVENALRLKQLLRGCEHHIPKLFICKGCKHLVRPHSAGDTTAAHFEHLKRNIECRYSEKSKAKQLYAKHKAEKAKARANR